MAALAAQRQVFRSSVGAAPSHTSPRTSVKACASRQGDAPVQIAAVTALAVTSLLYSTPAHAGVVLVQPETRKVFIDDSTPAAPQKKQIDYRQLGPKKSAPAVAAPVAAPAPRKVEATSEGGDLDPRAVALPGALVAVAGGAVALSKLDAGWDEFFAEAACKDSLNFAGYEAQIKNGTYDGTAGTKRVKGTKKGKK